MAKSKPDEPEYTGRRGRKALTPEQRREKAATTDAPPRGLKVGTYLPPPPDGIDPAAAEEWVRVGQWLKLTDRVSRLDHQAMMHYVTSYAIYADAMRGLLIGRQPLWGEVNGRPKPNKHAEIAVKHGAIVLRMARKFGMTARTRHLDHTGCGRPATPQQIHDLRGTVSGRPRRPLPIESQEWSPESVACPGWLSGAAIAEWTRLVDQLTAVDLWTPLDVGPVAVVAASYSLAAKCAVQMQDQPLVVPVRDSESVVEHPLGIIYERQFTLCEAIWQDYGMSPYDRQQFHHVEGDRQGKPRLQVFPGELA